MADSKSNYLEHRLLNHVLRGNVAGTAMPQPPAIYAALYLTSPGEPGAGTEVSGAGYTRMPVTFTAPADGGVENEAAVNFPRSSGAWGTVAYFALLDAATGGNVLYYGALSQALVVDGPGYRMRFDPGAIVVTEA